LIQRIAIFLFALLLTGSTAGGNDHNKNINFTFFGDTIHTALPDWELTDFTASLSEASIRDFYEAVNAKNYQPLINSLLACKEKNQLNGTTT
jgi:hypothetical protein